MREQARLALDVKAERMPTQGRIALAVFLALTGALPLPVAARNVAITFVPPPAWKKVATPGGNVVAAWRDAANKRLFANIVLSHEDPPQNLDTYVNTARRTLASIHAGSATTQKRTIICGRQPAYELAAVSQYRNLKVNIEEIVTDIGGKKMIAAYTRPFGTAPAPAAEASIRSICPAANR